MEPAVLLGKIGSMDETFLNGVKIGGEGLIDHTPIEAFKVERLYRLPEEHLDFNGENVLAVRVMNTFFKGGIYQNEMIIGDYRDLLLQKIRRDADRKNVEVLFFTFFILLAVLYSFLHFCGIREKEYWAFGFFVFIYAVEFFLDSLFFYETGLKTFAVQNTIVALLAFLPASLLFFLASALHERITFTLKTAMSVFALFSLGTLLFAGGEMYSFITLLWLLPALFSAFYAVLLSITAYRAGVPESGAILTGVTGLLLGGLALTLEESGILSLPDLFGDTLSEIVMLFFFLCIIYALCARFVRMGDALRSFSENILISHEEERKRVARELHDGVGQSLLALKLNLQMMEAETQAGRPAAPNYFNEVLSHVSDAINEVRNTANDLRPSHLEEMGIAGAIAWHGERVGERTGIKVTMEMGEGLEAIDMRVKDNLYRICQEALSNVLKHSGGTHVHISLKPSGNRLRLEIRDNGKGFELSQRGSGIGISTMGERAALLDGILKISSSDSGTTVYVEIPLK